MAIDSWGTVKLPNGQRKEVRREGDKGHVRDPGSDVHTTVPLNDFLGALVNEMDKQLQQPIEGVHLVEAIKMSDNPMQWKILTYVFGLMALAFASMSIS
ncbi:MAG: hypothetical protein KAQ96_03630 [Thermoplasmata archaeon]|nr:hypothetical protein [Thermoplasmata archaeon]